MQLFGLVNTLLAHEQQVAHASLNIITYSVIPLSPTSGLLRWVPNAPTLNSHITGFRKRRKIVEKAEQELLTRLAPTRTRESSTAARCERVRRAAAAAAR